MYAYLMIYNINNMYKGKLFNYFVSSEWVMYFYLMSVAHSKNIKIFKK